MLTLLLVVGAVTCSPLPSDFPAFAAQDAAHHVEVTHEVRHVTFEVSEEVSDATASSQVPSAVPPEDDPPIPTATTPPTRPEVHLPQHVEQVDLQPAHRIEQGPEDRPQEQDLAAQGFLSDEPSHAPSTEGSVKLEGDVEAQGAEEEGKDVEGDDGGLSEDTAAERVSGESTSGERDPLDVAAGVVLEDTAAEESSVDASATREQTTPKSEIEGGAAVVAEVTTAQEDAPKESSSQKTMPVQSVAEDIASGTSEIVYENVDAQEEEKKVTVNSPQEKIVSDIVSEESIIDEVLQEENVTMENMPEETTSSNNEQDDSPAHDLEKMQADETKETIVLAEAVAKSMENKDETQESKAEREAPLEKESSIEDATKSRVSVENEQDVLSEDGSQDSIIAEGGAQESVAVVANPKGEEEEVMPVPAKDEAGQGELNQEVLDPRIKKEVDMTEDKRSAEDSSENRKSPEEVFPMLVRGALASPSEDVEGHGKDNVAFINSAPSSLDSSEASPEHAPIMVEKQPDTDTQSSIQEAPLETPRKSRIYNEDDYEEPAHATHPEVPAVLEDTPKTGNKPKLVNSGLESMSMTSPTPEVPAEEVPMKVTQEDQVPPVSHEDVEAVTPSLDITELQERNFTAIDKVEEPPAIQEEEEEGDVVVVDDIPQSSSAAPIPSEDYHDSYIDPLDIGDLPDIDVTREDLPSNKHPVTNGEAATPGQSTDSGDEVAGDSSDLAAGDHMLEVEAGTPRVLPPQQEQVSAAAPSSLTVGCIIAIVFGVLVSLVILVGVGGFVVYQRRTLNRPKALNSDRGYAGSDSGGYIDDQVRVSYVNSQIDTPKGSPEDLISLDNDSFLNSLESMTIQNLWTDNIRHTKL